MEIKANHSDMQINFENKYGIPFSFNLKKVHLESIKSPVQISCDAFNKFPIQLHGGVCNVNINLDPKFFIASIWFIVVLLPNECT